MHCAAPSTGLIQKYHVDEPEPSVTNREPLTSKEPGFTIGTNPLTDVPPDWFCVNVISAGGTVLDCPQPHRADAGTGLISQYKLVIIDCVGLYVKGADTVAVVKSFVACTVLL